MLKVKEFLTRYQLIDFSNSKEFIGKVVSVTTKENTAMSSSCIYELFYEECDHVWMIDTGDSREMRSGKPAYAVCQKCRFVPNKEK